MGMGEYVGGFEEKMKATIFLSHIGGPGAPHIYVQPTVLVAHDHRHKWGGGVLKIPGSVRMSRI